MGLSNNPQQIDKSSWYYENYSNIEIIHEVRTLSGALIQTDNIKIPWRKLLSSLKRRPHGRT